MDFNQGFFDSTIDAHGRIELRDAVRLRGYINFRLLFWPHVYFTDATINNHKILRDLMFENTLEVKSDHNRWLPRDYGELLENKVIKIAVRDSLNPHFSSELRQLQKNAKNLSLPDESYTRKIDNLIKDDAITQYSLEEVSRLFSSKVKTLLRKNSNDKNKADQIKTVYKKLNEKYKNEEKIDFNQILEYLVRTGYQPESSIYKELKSVISECYNNNVPTILKINNQHIFQSMETIRDREDDKIRVEWQNENGECIPTYFNILALAYLPSSRLMEIFHISERQKFIDCLASYTASDGYYDYNDVCSAFERYIEEINRIFKDYFDIMAKGGRFDFWKGGVEKLHNIKLKILTNPVTPIISYSLQKAVDILADDKILAALELANIFNIFVMPHLKVDSTLFLTGEKKKLFVSLKNKSVITSGEPV